MEVDAQALMQETGFPEMFKSARRRIGTVNGFLKIFTEQNYSLRGVRAKNIKDMEAGTLAPDKEMAERLAASLWFFTRDPVAADSKKSTFIEAAAKAECIAKENGLGLLAKRGSYKADELLGATNKEKDYSAFLHRLINNAIDEIKQHDPIENEQEEEYVSASQKEPALAVRQGIIAKWGGHFFSEYRAANNQSINSFVDSLDYTSKDGKKSRPNNSAFTCWGRGERLLSFNLATAVAKKLVDEKSIKPEDVEQAVSFFSGQLRFYEKELVTHWEGEWEERGSSWRMQQLRLNQGHAKREFVKIVGVDRETLEEIEAAGVIDDKKINKFIKAYNIPKEDQKEFKERFSASKNKHRNTRIAASSHGDFTEAFLDDDEPSWSRWR